MAQAGPETLRANPVYGPPPLRPSDSSEDESPQKNTEEEGGYGSLPEYGSTYDEDVATYNTLRIQAERERIRIINELAALGVRVDNSGKIVAVRTAIDTGDGTVYQWLPADAAGSLPEGSAELLISLDKNNAYKDALEEWLNGAKLRKGTGLYKPTGLSGVEEFLEAEEAFRKRVQFYLDAAKDVLDIQDKEEQLQQDVFMHNAEQMQERQKTRGWVPGGTVGVPTPGYLSLAHRARAAAGLPSAYSAPNYSSPEEWAKAEGIPGYASGTKEVKMLGMGDQNRRGAPVGMPPAGVSQPAGAQQVNRQGVGISAAMRNRPQPGSRAVPWRQNLMARSGAAAAAGVSPSMSAGAAKPSAPANNPSVAKIRKKRLSDALRPRE